jgi:hypothetical protein
MQRVQQNAMQVMATARLRNIMTSRNESVNLYWSISEHLPSWPLRIAAIVTSSVDKIKTKPPQARKKLPSASVGGREGSIDFGGPSQRKKYVKQRKTANATSKLPQRAWIWTCYKIGGKAMVPDSQVKYPPGRGKFAHELPWPHLSHRSQVLGRD